MYPLPQHVTKNAIFHLEFSSESRILRVEEPEDGESPATVTLTVERLGGTVGVVSVAWIVTSSTGMCHLTPQNIPSMKYSLVGAAATDVLPVSNTLQFVTNATQQSFVLSILPDAIPELDEVSVLPYPTLSGLVKCVAVCRCFLWC